MANTNIITARESPGGPPPGASDLAVMRWGAKHPPADPAVSFAGQTVLVTGANTGLGFEAAVKFSALGADKLILGVRSAERGEAARARILERTGRPSNTISIVTVDLSTSTSVKAFIPALEKETSRLDIALLNAGICNPTYEASKEGWEMGVQVNVMSTALMAILLLPILRATAAATGRASKPHLVFVNSHGHKGVKEDWLAKSPDKSLLKVTNDADKWDYVKSYSLVKLLALAVMRAVARATAAGPNGPEIIVNAVCPGLCKTDLGRNFGMMAKIMQAPFQAIFGRTAEEGGRALVSATALGPESHGRFWHHDILFPMGELAMDDAFMDKTWSEILQAVERHQPDAQQILFHQG
ncbi:hypothetical protein B0T24DRAFT_10220 [Lasiosphaeria ovina]|uniref:Uncharacterized protein n=1 Tax=Lasiosphaeria ovina TaxID=92902 RepID=A0AAE0NJ48_9PEZI|nr:hypothetical protein B0T24DRAFT_10220 [Lasiosphaeria ovina]